MKFNEKLISLRKSKGMSQEELGEKLNVTRQTISKWELGQTTPEMDKLMEMAKLFGMSLDELTNEEEAKIEETVERKDNEENLGRRKKVSIVLIIILVLLMVIAIIYAATEISNKRKEQALEDVDSLFSEVLDYSGEQMKDVINVFGEQVQNMQNIQNDTNNQIDNATDLVDEQMQNMQNIFKEQLENMEEDSQEEFFTTSLENFQNVIEQQELLQQAR